MKRFFLIASLLLAGYSALAQDIITKKDGTDIQAKILEVTTSDVKYKKYSNLEGPVYTIPKSDILIVRYMNGENEVFTESQTPEDQNSDNFIVPGMKYKDYKDYYNTRDYVRMPGDPYSPFWVGFGDFVIPGLGNAITGEWGRAACFFFANLGLEALCWTQTGIVETSTGYSIERTGLYWAFWAARIGMNIYSICDAVKVAKAKNMYNQDLRNQRASFDFNIEPYFTFAPAASNVLQPAAGLSLKLNF